MTNEQAIILKESHAKQLVDAGLIESTDTPITVRHVIDSLKTHSEKYLYPIIDVVANELGNIASTAMFLGDELRGVIDQLEQAQVSPTILRENAQRVLGEVERATNSLKILSKVQYEILEVLDSLSDDQLKRLPEQVEELLGLAERNSTFLRNTLIEQDIEGLTKRVEELLSKK